MAATEIQSSIVRRLPTVLVFVIFSSLHTVHSFDGCRVRYGPRGCTDGTYEGVLVTCNGDGEYSEIPSMIPSETVYISLANFKFDSLSRANFTKFKYVQCMSIIDSQVSSVDFDTFADMAELREVELHNTQIRGDDLNFINHPDFKPVRVAVTGSPSISMLNFRGTPYMEKLTGLSLRGNGITSIDPSLFSYLKNLVSLDLSDNALKDLEWDKLSDMNKLNELYLSGNRLQMIPQRVFRVFFAVKELKIAGNPFHCNCNLMWLKTFYEDTSDRIIDLSEVECVSPFQSLMVQSKNTQFACSQPSMPMIEWHSIDGMPEYYAFNCSSSADPAPTLTFNFPEDKKLITPPSEDLAKLKTSTPRIISKMGHIECIATNSEGSQRKYEGLAVTGKASSTFSCHHWTLLTTCSLFLLYVTRTSQ